MQSNPSQLLQGSSAIDQSLSDSRTKRFRARVIYIVLNLGAMDAKRLTHKMQVDRKSREEHHQMMLQHQNKKFKVENEVHELEQKIKASEHKQKLRQRLKDMSDSRARSKLEREQKAQEWHRRMKEIKGKDYVYKKFEAEYQKSQLPEIQKHQDILKAK